MLILQKREKTVFARYWHLESVISLLPSISDFIIFASPLWNEIFTRAKLLISLFSLRPLIGRFKDFLSHRTFFRDGPSIVDGPRGWTDESVKILSTVLSIVERFSAGYSIHGEIPQEGGLVWVNISVAGSERSPEVGL